MMQEDLGYILGERREKLNAFLKAKMNPYPSRSSRSFEIGKALADFENLSKSGKDFTLAGRIRAIRKHGKISFFIIEDESAKIQAGFRKDILGGEKYAFLKNFDEGDFIEVTGNLELSKTNEKTLWAKDCKILSKSLRPLPEKFHGLKDVEEKLRKRYLDLIANPEVKEMFRKKAVFFKSIREFLEKKGFMEVHSPALEAVAGGAEANPFATHLDALDIDMYLRISLELYQKRLIVGGYEKIYEIGRVFRNEGIDKEHLQDYEQIEFYWAYANYEDLMPFIEEFYRYFIEKTFGTLKFDIGRHKVDFSKDKWERVTYKEFIKKYSGVDIDKIKSSNELEEIVKKLGVKNAKNMGRGRLIDQILKKACRPKEAGPIFLIDHPVEVSPLSKRSDEDPSVTERVQIIAGGSELCNAYSELNDPIDQKDRFEAAAKLREGGDKEAHMFDEDFIEALEYGMPPTAGFGMSERVFAVLAGKSIRETVFFPMIKPKED